MENSWLRREFLLSAAGALAWAQDATFSSSVNVVNVLTSVRDKRGNFVSDLSRDEFLVEEDGCAQTLRYFEHQKDLAWPPCWSTSWQSDSLLR